MKIGDCKVKVIKGRSRYSYALARTFINWYLNKFKFTPELLTISWGDKITSRERQCDISIEYLNACELYDINALTYFGEITFEINGVTYGTIPSE